MKFSLIVATIGRVAELERLLKSLEAQRGSSFELIVVDQNPDDRLLPLVASYAAKVPLTHLRSERGLSRARNLGLKHVTGEVVAFPDDDCWYGPGLLADVQQWLEAHSQIDGLSVTSRDTAGRLTGCHWDKRSGTVNRANIWRRAISTAIFLRRKVIESVGDFDVELGVGSGTRWGSGEETDYLLRALRCGFQLEYVRSLYVFHERPVLGRGAGARGRSYGLGFGRVQRKHKYPFRIIAYYWLRSAGGALISIAKLRPAEARLHWGNLKGRVIGWLH